MEDEQPCSCPQSIDLQSRLDAALADVSRLRGVLEETPENVRAVYGLLASQWDLKTTWDAGTEHARITFERCAEDVLAALRSRAQSTTPGVDAVRVRREALSTAIAKLDAVPTFGRPTKWGEGYNLGVNDCRNALRSLIPHAAPAGVPPPEEAASTPPSGKAGEGG